MSSSAAPSAHATPFVPPVRQSSIAELQQHQPLVHSVQQSQPQRGRGGVRGRGRGQRGSQDPYFAANQHYLHHHQHHAFGPGSYVGGGYAPAEYGRSMHHHHHHHHHHHQGNHQGFAHEPEVDVDESSQEFCKALAKVAKPRPPWSIGTDPTNDIGVEMGRIEAFFAQSAKDKQDTGDVWEALRLTLTELDAAPLLQYTGCNSWSFFPFRGRFSVAAPGVKNATAAQLGPALFRNGCRLQREFVDSRGLPCFLVEHAATQREVLLRIGESGAAAADSVRAILRYKMSGEVRSALNCLIVLLRQSRIIDDLEPAALSDEAAAVMVMAIANSYGERPAPDRLLIDFFLTYGFKAHFDSDALSVCADGMVTPIAKAHPDAAASILDPANPSRNLAAGMNAKKLQFMQSTFNYCYHVVSEFAKESDPQKQRGQSPLSTVLGGEPFWPRVVELAQLNVDPYVSFLHTHRSRAMEEVCRQRIRKSTGQQPGRQPLRRN